MIAGALITGLLFSTALYTLVAEFKRCELYKKIFAILLMIATLYCGSLYCEKEYWVFALIGVAVGIVICFVYLRIFVNSKLYGSLTVEQVLTESVEEDFMTTKRGKIITIVVAILVVYAVISTACILKLNQKINSMVVITDELREEITR